MVGQERRLVAQAFISRTAGAAELMIVNWWAFTMTGSAAAVGVLTAARLVPLILAAPRMGALADRHNPFRVLSLVLAFGAVATAASAVLAVVSSTSSGKLDSAGAGGWNSTSFLMLVGLVLVRSSVTAAEPALRTVAMSRLSGDGALLRSMASLSLALGTSAILGPAMAGGVMVIAGVPMALGGCAAAYAFSALLCRGMQPATPEPSGDSRTSSAGGRRFSPWATVIGAVRRRPRLGAQLILAWGPMLCVFPYTAMLPILASVLVEGNASAGLTYLSIAAGGGALMGALMLRFIASMTPTMLAATAALGLTIPLALLGTFGAHHPAVGIILVAVIGIVGQIYRTANRTATLLLADEHERGAVSGVASTDRVLIPLGALIFGLIADTAGVPTMAITMALANLLLCAPAVIIMARYR